MRALLRTTVRLATACAVASVVASAPAAAMNSGDDWPFNDQYGKPFLFVHAFIKYEFNPLWVQEWERNLVSRSGFRGTSGSLSGNDLLTVFQLDLSEPIGRGFRFLYVGDWLEGLSAEPPNREHFVGLEKIVFRESGLQFLVQPMSNKEEFDLLAGVLLASASRESYLRLWLRLEDPVYSQRNQRAGRQVQSPIGPQWTLRLEAGRWQLFSQGRYTRRSERVFDDPVHSPAIAGEGRQHGRSQSRLRFLTGDWAFLELQATHHQYEEEIVHRDPAASYHYRSHLLSGRLLWYFPLGGSFRGRAELHRVCQDGEARGARDYDYERREVPWAVHLEWLPSASHTWEVGYVGSDYDWQYTSRDGTTPFEENGAVDKLQLAWAFTFSESARVLLSVSHQPRDQRFGGGNIQLQALF